MPAALAAKPRRPWPVGTGLFGLVLAALLRLVPAASLAEEMQFLDLRGPGTAIVTIDDETRTAFITDGGKSGTRGVAGALLDGRHLLDSLLRRGIERLVMICSHPHSDHLDGLVDLVRDPRMGDPQLREVTFVDSAMPEGSRLLDAYRRAWPEARTPPGRTVAHRSAVDADVLGPLTPGGPERRVAAHNFAYAPAAGEKHPHGRCVITSFDLRRGDRSCRVVDFDDAHDELVGRWAEWARADPAARRPDTIVLPHHGSAHSDLTPLLDERIRPRSAVITVNPDNTYRHPGPATLLALVKALGAANVHFTGRSANLELTAEGLPPRASGDRLRLDYELFLRRSALAVEQEALDLEDREARGTITPLERTKLETLRETLKTYADLAGLMGLDDAEKRAQARELEIRMRELQDRNKMSALGAGIDPDAAVDPVLVDRERRAVTQLALDSQADGRLGEVREALAQGRLDDAARLAAAAADHPGLTPREREALALLAAAGPLLTGRPLDLGPDAPVGPASPPPPEPGADGEAAGARPDNGTGPRKPGGLPGAMALALLWPQIAGAEGAEALRQAALREGRRVLAPASASADPLEADRIRWTLQALSRSGADLDAPGRALADDLRYRLLLEGRTDPADARAVDTMPPDRAAGQLDAFKSALAGRAPTADTVRPGARNPLIPPPATTAPPAVAAAPTSPILGLAALAPSSPPASRPETEAPPPPPAIDTAAPAERLLKELDAAIALRRQDAAIRDRLTRQAEAALGGPLLASESLDLRRQARQGAARESAIGQIRQAREELIDRLQALGAGAISSSRWSELPNLRNRDIGLTYEAMEEHRRKVEADRYPGYEFISGVGLVPKIDPRKFEEEYRKYKAGEGVYREFDREARPRGRR